LNYVENLRSKVGNIPLILNGSVVVVINSNSELLLQQRLDGVWGLPGGLMELGESFEETAKREVFEETGLIVENLSFVKVLSGKDYFVKLPNKDQFYSVTAIFITRDFTGDLVVNEKESLALEFFPLNSLPENTGKNVLEGLKEINHYLNI
jgi:ADP-ribose pyrophosphatase YjhB (NUDIX family)